MTEANLANKEEGGAGNFALQAFGQRNAPNELGLGSHALRWRCKRAHAKDAQMAKDVKQRGTRNNFLP
jgi:hypothetical protein